MIKVLYLPLNASENDQAPMYLAWRNNKVDLRIFDFYFSFLKDQNAGRVNVEFLEVVKEFQPDLIHMQLQMTNVIQPETLEKARSLVNKKVILTNWSGDIRNEASKELLKISPVVDHTFISSTGQLELYRASGAKNVAYWQIGYDPNIFYPEEKRIIQYEISFAANAYAAGTFPDAKLRTDIAAELKNKLGNKFALHGSGYSSHLGRIFGLSPKKINSVYNSSRTILSVSNFNDVSNYFSDRLLICLAAGRPVISYRFPQSETYFTDKVDYLVAHSKEEIYDLVLYCQKNPEAAEKIGKQGAEKVRLQHTYQSRVAELLYLVGLR